MPQKSSSTRGVPRNEPESFLAAGGRSRSPSFARTARRATFPSQHSRDTMSDDAEVKADAPVPTKVRILSLSHGAPSLVSASWGNKISHRRELDRSSRPDDFTRLSRLARAA